jgi:integrase
MGELQSIRVVKVSKGRYCISVVWGGCRYRFYNGHYIGSWSKPQSLPQTKRLRAMEELCLEYQRAIELGWTPIDDWSDRLNRERVISKSILDEALASKLKQGLSESYSRKLTWIVKHLKRHLRGTQPNPKRLAAFINESHWTPATRNIIRRHLIAFEKEMEKYGYEGSIKTLTSKTRTEERLHKPFRNVEAVLEEISHFDTRLHLCCLLAFGCLLRPHREIRLLTWGDISDDFGQVSLGGNQNKGKRNRIVPIGPYIQTHLRAFKRTNSASNTNIFSGNKKPFNRDYFKTLWGRYKKESKLLEIGQTLYSFRHTGAIQVYEKTGSLVKLQQVMGHSTLQVSLTYLRGLEVKRLNLEDLPCLYSLHNKSMLR